MKLRLNPINRFPHQLAEDKGEDKNRTAVFANLTLMDIFTFRNARRSDC